MNDEEPKPWNFLDDLNHFINEAERNKKWLYNRYQDMYFSPEELRKYNSEGRFRWGISNWELVDPQIVLDKKREELKRKQEEFDQLEKRINS